MQTLSPTGQGDKGYKQINFFENIEVNRKYHIINKSIDPLASNRKAAQSRIKTKDKMLIANTALKERREPGSEDLSWKQKKQDLKQA